MAKNNGRDTEDLKDIVEDIESLGTLDKTDFEDMEIMREDETFATMVEEHISDEEMDELTKAFRDLEGQISTPDLAEDFASMELEEGEFGDMSEEDLDAMLKSLIEKDEDEVEAWVPMDNIDAQLEQEPEIYEGEGADKEIDLSVLESSEKTKRLATSPRKWMVQQYRSGDKGSKVLVLSIVAMSALVVTSLLFLTGMLIATNIGRSEQDILNVTPPAYAFNNASHSLVNLSAPLGEDTIFLNRLLLDEVASVFYFGGVLDPWRYTFALNDFNGRAYARNIGLGLNPAREQASDQTIVRFEALDPMAEGFVILITDLHTGQTSSIELAFESNAIAPGRYIVDPIMVDAGLSDVTVAIDHGIFSAAASSLNFSFSYGNPDVSLVFGESAVTPPMGIRHMGATVPAMGTLQTSYFLQEGITLGAMDFNPLRTLTGRVEVVFGQMYKRHELNISMSTDGMFATGDDRARTIELGDHIINIHGLAQQGDFFVMPLYGVPRVEHGEEVSRVPTTMEVTLTGMSNHPHARQIRIPGTVQYDGRGTDVTFDTRGSEAILEIPRGNLYLEFESISVRLPEFSVTIDLDDIGFESLARTNAMKSAIELAFVQDMPRFAGQFGAEHNVEHAVQVRQMHLDGSVAYARVIERLAFTEEGSLQEVIRHLTIVANVTAVGNVEITGVAIESVEQRP